jgi:DNA-binding XRE family transcriptional regulator
MPEMPREPQHAPLAYVEGGWPHGHVRELTEAEGGEFVRYQVDQVRQFVADMIDRREARGIRPAALARLTGLRPNTISDLEAGQTYPQWKTIARIAAALEADIRLRPRTAQRIDPTSHRSDG